jgi:hypothetical protein
MAEFMNQDDEEQGKVFRHVPTQGGILVGPELDGIDGDEEPEPMDVNANAGERKEFE